MTDANRTGATPPADEQPRTKLERSDPNQTNEGALDEQNNEQSGNAPTEQESGGGYGNHAPVDQGGA